MSLCWGRGDPREAWSSVPGRVLAACSLLVCPERPRRALPAAGGRREGAGNKLPRLLLLEAKPFRKMPVT